MARIDFNIKDVRPFSGVNQTLPQGSYEVEIIAERIIDLRDGRSQGLSLDYQVLSGQYKGQRIRDVLNLWHVNTDAVNMARARLAAIASAVNVQTLTDTAELQRKPFQILLSIRVYNGKEYNNVDEYLPLDRRATAPSIPQPVKPSAQPRQAPWDGADQQESNSGWF